MGLSLLAASLNFWMSNGKEKCPHLFVSSHFHSLVSHLQKDAEVLSFHTMEVISRGERLEYRYELVDGFIDCSFAAYTAAQVYIRLKNGLSIDPVILCDDDEDTLLRMKSIKESFLRWDFDNDCKGFINLASTVLMKRDSQEEYRKNKDGDCRSEKTVGSEHIADMSTDFARESDQDAAMMDASVMSRDDESAHDRILNAASASVKKADVAITRMSAIFDSLEASSSERPSILRKLQACSVRPSRNVSFTSSAISSPHLYEAAVVGPLRRKSLYDCFTRRLISGGELQIE
uniref:DNA mismatch repair proteins mutS family domain-containing protein n=2 Tax=Parascaris univalens TaxID=6257 RepID=A0A915A2L7_PARUN